MSDVLVIGIGNEYRSDDAAGIVAVRRLAALELPHVIAREHSGEGISLLECWRNTSDVILIDAVHSGSHPGTIHRFDARSDEIPASFFHYSTHAIGVAEAITLARTLRRLPSSLIVYGIEGANFASGCVMTAEVEASITHLIDGIQQRGLR